MANSSKTTNYVMGETVAVTVTAKVSSSDDGTLALRLGDDQFGSKYLMLAPGDAFTVNRLVPADGPIQAGDVWRDRRGKSWFATDNGSFVGEDGLVRDQDVVMNDAGPIELVMRSQPAEAVPPPPVDLPLPVVEHYEVSAIAGGRGEPSGVTCCCGTDFDGFASVDLARRSLAVHIEDRSAVAR